LFQRRNASKLIVELGWQRKIFCFFNSNFGRKKKKKIQSKVSFYL